jgi:C1A family cysteine protease
MFVLFLALFGFSLASIEQDVDYPAFVAWMTQYDKVYTEEETVIRFEKFKHNLDVINSNNRRVTRARKGAMFALNQFSDLTREEFSQNYLLRPFKPTPESERQYFAKPNVAAPASFDWRDKSKVTAIKNQRQCGSCWAFSVTENIESVWMIAKGLTNHTMPPLAPQQIVDCDKADGGCNGGDTPTAYKYVMACGGLETEKDYPYVARNEPCHFDKAKEYAHISGWKYAASKGDEKTMVDNTYALAPLSICVDAQNWQHYSSGIMTAHQCAIRVRLDHCVQIIGYDTAHNPPFWMVRNSWGESWGEHGLIFLQYGQNTCGLSDEVTTAHV